MHADQANPVVLVMDCDPALGTVLVFYLWQHGIQSVFASSGAQAIDLLRHYKKTLRLALIAMDQADSDGSAFASHLRAEAPAVRLCFMTTGNGDHTAADLVAMGAEHVFTKPFSTRELLIRLRLLLTIQPSADA
jgi:DNA-binding response OmpR family regulator